MSLFDRLMAHLGRRKQPDAPTRPDTPVGLPLAPGQVLPVARHVSPLEYFGRSDSWHHVTSSWVHSYAFYPTSKTHGLLRVRYKDKDTGAYRVTCEYRDIPVSSWEAFQAAPSKGKFVHQSGLYGWPYTLV